jgi:phage tail tape-measure protein
MKTLTLGTFLLGCCMAVAAQMGSTPNQTPPSSTPSTFPQDQTGQMPSNPATPADPSALPPDTSATGHVSQSADQSTQATNAHTSLEGCLSRGSDGNFLLADSSGNNIQLRGDSSQLSNYIGNQVRIEGTATDSSTTAGSMSSSGAGAAKQIAVSDVHKVSDTCTSSATTNR